MSSMTVYSKPKCVQCNATYRDLDKKGIEYSSVDISQDLEAYEFAVSLGHMSAPVVVVRDEEGNVSEHWAGYDPEKIGQYA